MSSKKKNIDVAKLAQLATDVYHIEGNKSLQGCGDWRPWNLFGGRMHQGAQIGFYARCYYSNESKEIVVAIRGTHGTEGRSGAAGGIKNVIDGVLDAAADFVDFAPQWLVNSVSQALYSQVSEAKSFVKSVQDYCALERTPYTFLGITWHSLGGGLAAICALEYSIQCVTFNPAPIDSYLHSKSRNFYGDEKTFQYVTNVISGNDFVSTLNNIVSRTLFDMPMEHSVPGYTLKVPVDCGHSIVKLANAIKSDRVGNMRPFL